MKFTKAKVFADLADEAKSELTTISLRLHDKGWRPAHTDGHDGTKDAFSEAGTAVGIAIKILNGLIERLAVDSGKEKCPVCGFEGHAEYCPGHPNIRTRL